jgi:hypothetical protein
MESEIIISWTKKIFTFYMKLITYLTQRVMVSCASVIVILKHQMPKSCLQSLLQSEVNEIALNHLKEERPFSCHRPN